MSGLGESGLLAIDVGNSQVKLGWFPPETACTSESKLGELPIATVQLPQPEEVFFFSHVGVSGDLLAERVGGWLEGLGAVEPRRFLASVHAGVAKEVMELFSLKPHVLSAAELPIEVRVDEPEKVGIDRLLGAVAANRLRERGRAAVVVSLGTACTVNLIAADGAFEGGAILPGISMSAEALHKGTSALPLLTCEGLEAPADAVGKSTQAAISSGLVWGVVGAVQELIDRMTQHLDQPPQIFVTGGEAPRIAPMVAGACHVPNMVLAGIRIAAGELP